MNRSRDILRQSLTAVLATLMLTLSVAQPVLGVADLAHQAAVESQHDPGDCPQGHDHTICTQLGANYAAPSSVAVRGQDRPTTHVVLPNRFVAPVLAVLRDGNPTRAPPLG